ncbi:MAG: hypothetical protein JWN30_122 [Bacilli bacterium]|nr:hypothetical protein [Bacilli bacterium]
MAKQTGPTGQQYCGRKQTGQRAEQLAKEYLLQKGYQILDTNRRNRYGELDIVARLGDMLIFVEVRAKSSATQIVHVLEAIPRTKQIQVRKLVELYLAQHFNVIPAVRIDAVLVQYDSSSETPTIIHLENAF